MAHISARTAQKPCDKHNSASNEVLYNPCISDKIAIFQSVLPSLQVPKNWFLNAKDCIQKYWVLIEKQCFKIMQEFCVLI